MKKKELLAAINQEYCEAYLSRKISSLDGILADDWTLVTADCGDVVDKKKQLKDLSDGTLRVEAIEDSDVTVRVYGDAAIVAGRRRSKASYKKRDVSDLTRFTQCYILQEGKWRCVSTQVTSLSAETEKQLLAISEEYREAYLSGNIPSLDGILADDWTLVTADCGDVVNKEKQLKDLSDGTLRVEAIEDSDITVRVYGDAAIVAGRRHSKVSYKKRDVSDLTRYSQYYILQEGKWRCVSTQVTSIQINQERHGD